MAGIAGKALASAGLLLGGALCAAVLSAPVLLASVHPAASCGGAASTAAACAGAGGTADDALWMLRRVAAAMRADAPRALRAFARGEDGFRTLDLYVFCIGVADGRISAHPEPMLMGQDARQLRDPNGHAFAAEMLDVAREGSVSEVRYLFPRLGRAGAQDRVRDPHQGPGVRRRLLRVGTRPRHAAPAQWPRCAVRTRRRKLAPPPRTARMEGETMTLSGILKQKGCSVAHVAPACTIAEVVETLNRHRIGAVLVCGEAKGLLGVVSERDVVRCLSLHGAGVLEMTAGQLMTPNPRTAPPATSIPEAMAIMTEGRFRHLPVVEDGHLVGIVSIGDVVKARIALQDHEVDSLRAYVAGAA